MNNIQDQFTNNVDITKLEDIDCENCDSTGFVPVYTLKKLPAILSEDGQEHIIPIFQRFECIDCGYAIMQ